MNSIDLHTHTRASDGSLSPAELVDLALKSNIAAIAITDHDTMNGVQEALLRAHELNDSVEVIPGMEVSSFDSDFVYGLHILAYFIGKTEEELDVIVRGVRSNITRARLGPKEAISIIHKMGVIAVLAHPKDCFISMKEMDKLIEKLAAWGLKGMECYYTTHSAEETEDFLKIAKKHGMLITGGTDYHGQKKLDTALGRGYGNLSISYSLLAALKASASTKEMVAR